MGREKNVKIASRLEGQDTLVEKEKDNATTNILNMEYRKTEWMNIL